MDQDEWAVVPIERGQERDTLRALLDLADSPLEVVFVPGRIEARVPDALAEKYRKSLNPTRRTRTKKENSDG
jgi:hypothetical protein